MKNILLDIPNHNIGLEFKVLDTGCGPALQIENIAHGLLFNSFQVSLNNEALKKIGEFFIESSKENYSTPDALCLKIV